ncbi:MAG: hypothetical protein AAF639_25615 [Chloroflexota bacterium]
MSKQNVSKQNMSKQNVSKQNVIHRDWDVLLVGGPSGVGKTSVSYRLARHFDVGITEVDDLYIVLETLTTPEQMPLVHYWQTKPESVQLSAEDILEHQIAIGRLMLPALKAVIANHIETQTPVVLDGDFILPALMAKENTGSHESEFYQLDRIRAVFLYEPDEAQIVRNYLLREPDEGAQTGRAHVSWLYGEWLQEECVKHGVLSLPATPWESVFERIVAGIERQP